MTPTRLRKAAVAAIAGTGLIHLVLTPEYWGEKPYVGALFIGGAATSAWVAARLWRRDDAAAWVVGALTAAGMGVGFILSRTTGLPGFHPTDWELSGIVSVLLEIGFIAAALPALRAVAGGRERLGAPSGATGRS